MQKIKPVWVRTNQYPFYYIRSEDNLSFEAISIFATDSGEFLLSKHNINITDIPKSELLEWKSEVGIKDESYKLKAAIESALTEGYGDENSLGCFAEGDLEKLSSILTEYGIECPLVESDFK